jgi:23S rRNA pseudouridine2605 synthase
MKEKSGSGKGAPPQQTRLNKYIANTGLCSRREADALILSGVIQVNGKTVTELGTRVGPGDRVTHKGKKLLGEKKIYLLLNKPKDCVTTVKDTHGRKTVLDLVRGCCTERIYPVGRLDRNTTGVLLLTNDGELAEALTHPSYNRKKVYHVFLNRKLSPVDMAKIRDGLELEDGFIRPDEIDYVESGDKKQVGMEIHSGRNRIVRRIFEQLDYRIEKLDRVYFAGLTKKGIPRGGWRHLNNREISMLKMSVPGKARNKTSKRP